MKQVIALFLFDAKAHWKYILSTFVIMAILPIVLRIGLGHMNVFVVLAISFGLTIGLPFTFVGQERLKGTIAFVVGLPLSRMQIVLIKTAESALWSAALVAVATLPTLLASNDRTLSLLTLAVFEPPAIFASSCILTSAYFLFSAQAVNRGFALTIFAITIVTARAPWDHARIPAISPSAAIALLYACSLVTGSSALLVAVRSWGFRAGARNH